MSNFKTPSDAAFQIKTEGETMSTTFKVGLPASGQGLVEWTIPSPAQGCADGTKGAYCGIVFLLSTSPLTPEQAPQNGNFYTADPTANGDLHSGDMINGAYVIGAFYEGEKINQGEDPTSAFVVNDVKSNTPYFVAGYAVDCQGRYHMKGIRAYSDDLVTPQDVGTPATQQVSLGTEGVLPTDGTLLTPGMTYAFEIDIIPNIEDSSQTRTVLFAADGLDISTYQDLLDEINKALALADNPLQSPTAPNAGRYYWDGTQIFQFDGTTNVPVDAIIEPTDPTTPAPGTYWWDGTTLQVWDVITPGAWAPVTVINHNEDPTNLTEGDDYWFDGTSAYRRCGNTWCEETLFNQETDPTLPTLPEDCGEYWYDTTNEILYAWNNDAQAWEQTFAITWDSDPVSIADGSHWVDLTDNSLYIRNTGVWDLIPLEADAALPTDPRVVISEVEPTSPSINLYWYNPTTEELKLFNTTTLVFDDIDVLVWEGDPTVIGTCDLWWNSTTDELSKWDVVNTQWNLQTFTIAAEDPSTPPTVEVNDLWYVPSTMKLYRWNGLSWDEISYIDKATDPTTPAQYEAWFNTTTSEWFVWDFPVAGWNAINPTDSATDPTTLANGTFWFDTTTPGFFERVGAAWVAVPYTTMPLAPATGTLWFDTTNDILYRWNGTEWVEHPPMANVYLNENGDMEFSTHATGSCVDINIRVPELAQTRANPNLATGAAGYDFYNTGQFDYTDPTATQVGLDIFLFDYLVENSQVFNSVPGSDGVNPVPSYLAAGVGDDGSPDERRRMIDSIYQQLGYPTVEVEVTLSQMNIAMDIALSELRKKSSVAYKRAFFFLDTQPRQQHYQLTDECVGFNKIVTVMSAYRMTSAFLSSAHGAGVYGQVVLQHLYNMGTFDLLSYHLVSQYVEQMEHLFATRLTYHWHESDRMLSFYQAFSRSERILLDTTMERTEQELLTDRWTKLWIERFVLAEAMRILSQIRGKYATLPGAGGGVSLNAADLQAQHDMIKDQLYQEIDDYVVNDVEDIGMESSFIIG